MRLPAAADSGVWQERVACPFKCTVHAPHRDMPQPYLVPVMLRWSRSTHSRGVSGSASTGIFLPLTVRVTMGKPCGSPPLLGVKLVVAGGRDVAVAEDCGRERG